jgi:hypothetical protein
MRRPNPKEDPMVHRSSKFVVALLAVILTLMVAAPASAYPLAPSTFLRLSRLDALTCGTQIEIQATLTSQHGPKQDHPIGGATISYAIVKGSATLTPDPASLVTSPAGTWDEFVTIDCTNATQVIQIVATGPGGAQARITLTLPAGHVKPAQLARAPKAL